MKNTSSPDGYTFSTQVQYAETCKKKAEEYLQSKVSSATSQVHSKPRTFWEEHQKAIAMKVSWDNKRCINSQFKFTHVSCFNRWGIGLKWWKIIPLADVQRAGWAASRLFTEAAKVAMEMRVSQWRGARMLTRCTFWLGVWKKTYPWHGLRRFLSHGRYNIIACGVFFAAVSPLLFTSCYHRNLRQIGTFVQEKRFHQNLQLSNCI